MALSSARELPTGARVAVLLASGLFRLDLRHLEDTLKISIRNLSGSPIHSLPDDGPPTTVLTTDDFTIERPVATNARMRLRIGAREANVVLSALSGPEHGLARVTAQAIIGAAAERALSSHLPEKTAPRGCSSTRRSRSTSSCSSSSPELQLPT